MSLEIDRTWRRVASLVDSCQLLLNRMTSLLSKGFEVSVNTSFAAKLYVYKAVY